MIKSGKLRGEKIQYDDGIGCCVWYPFDQDSDGDGICFDFDYADIDDFITILNKIKLVEAVQYEEKE